ncbi:uncharacterized protein CPUR_05546 [Claviceps purpurea 20.1]|uniref:F-box domain-containing protein n=1 Tax=Claviceps purpurea (strain 20.1) TaxID=1111077 RepID=M1VWQ7_CLAP2|nr:uncharacterized protein CPUR_05546 [Claviceps purpurea 20.1]
MPSSRAFDSEPSMADLIESGRQLHAAKKYRRSLVLFARAMGSCPCAGGARRVKCTCKNFEHVAAQGGSIFREAMYTCHCEVGKTFSKCDNEHHILALDLRAASFEAMDKLVHAMRDAEWILELAPRLPDGYLRVGRIAQLQKNDEYAWKMYSAGIEANKESAVGSSPKLQQLYGAHKSLHWRFSRKDPLCLPAELVTQIFLFLDRVELSVCLRVCKRWKRTLTSSQHCPLWRNMIFDETCSSKGAPRVGALRKMLSWAGDGGARTISIARELSYHQSKFTLLLKASPHLEHLEIWKLPKKHLSFPSNEKIWSRLKHFSMQDRSSTFHQIPVDVPGGFPHTFLQNAASSLEHLDFTGIPEQWFGSVPLIPLLPVLKTLRINHGMASNQTPLSIFHLSVAFPRLEQLSFVGLAELDPEPVAIWRERGNDIWPHLKVLMFQSYYSRSSRERSILTLRYLMCLDRGNTLQHISLDVRSQDRSDIFSGCHELLSDVDVARHSTFQNLQSFRSRTLPIAQAGARLLLSSAIEARRLTSFDMVFGDYWNVRTEPTDASARHLKDYDWLRGAPSIQELGCYDCYFPLYPDNDQFLPLAQFLASFPNLQTLILHNSRHAYMSQVSSVAIVILRLTHLKTIYMCGMSGVSNELRQVAQAHGVQLKLESPPRPWPVTLRKLET